MAANTFAGFRQDDHFPLYHETNVARKKFVGETEGQQRVVPYNFREAPVYANSLRVGGDVTVPQFFNKIVQKGKLVEGKLSYLPPLYVVRR